MSAPLLQAEGLRKGYVARRGRPWRRERRFWAVDEVDLAVARGETLGIVGESGCGKSTLARLLLGLTPADAGSVEIDGTPLPDAEDAAWRALRRRAQIVHQDAAGSLDPRMPVRAQVLEAVRIHGLPETDADVALEAVGLGGALAERYPHEMSGGQVQRVVLARALALGPDLLVLDEPVSALDLSIQAQIVNLLVRLQRERGLAYVFVSHDIGVVRHVSDRIAVMYLGRIVETGPHRAVGEAPAHPYTRALLSAVPEPDPARRGPPPRPIGDPPNPAAPPGGCRFHPRCPAAVARCGTEAPTLRPFGPVRAACHRLEDLLRLERTG